MQARLVRFLARLAWRYLLDARRYVTLRDLVLETQDGATQLGLVVISTRGVFVVETWDAAHGVADGCASWFQRGANVVSCYDNPVHYCDERARLIAGALEEDGQYVSPVIVFTGPCALPEERPPNVVSDLGLIQYIRSFKADVYSSRRMQEIESRLARLRAAPLQAVAA